MENTIQETIELFAANVQTIKKEFIWQNKLTKRSAALLYARENKQIDCEAIRQCHAIIKQNAGILSVFRGDLVLFVAALLSLSPDPLRLFNETLLVYDMLKEAKFHRSFYLAIAAYEIAALADADKYSDVVARTRAFYEGMKTNRFFRTGQDDYIFAAMLGISDLNTAVGVERIEKIYSYLKSEFWDKNSVLALAQVLVLGGSDDDMVDRVLSLRDALRAVRIKLDKAYTLSALGVLAMLPVENSVLVSEIDEAEMMLRSQKGLGAWSVTTQEILLFASAVVAGVHTRNLKDGALSATLSTSIANIVIAQQAAMIAIIAASASVASSSSS